VLADFAVLRVPLDERRFDEHLSRAEQEGLTPLEFLARLVGQQADLTVVKRLSQESNACPMGQ
jgi:hypothetical protein